MKAFKLKFYDGFKDIFIKHQLVIFSSTIFIIFYFRVIYFYIFLLNYTNFEKQKDILLNQTIL